jgi:hypothetical protein
VPVGLGLARQRAVGDGLVLEGQQVWLLEVRVHVAEAHAPVPIAGLELVGRDLLDLEIPAHCFPERLLPLGAVLEAG